MPGSRCGKFFSAPAKLLPKLVQDPMERWKSPRKGGKTCPLSSPLNVYLFLSSARFASQLEHTTVWHKLEFSNINKWNRLFRLAFVLKVAFFQKVRFGFLDLQIFKKKYSKKLSWTWNLNFPPIIVKCYWRDIKISSSG